MKKALNIAIDASNISGGGGLVHLLQILMQANPDLHDFKKIIVYGSTELINKIPNVPWVMGKSHPWLDRGLFWRIIWRKIYFLKGVRKFNCNVIFSPGALLLYGNTMPVVCMNQNLLPFFWREISRFGYGWMLIKNIFLRINFSISLTKSSGVIFLSQYAKKEVEARIGQIKSKTKIIPHGVSSLFLNPPKEQYDIGRYSEVRPFKILCVSPLWPYKNYLEIMRAVNVVRKLGYPIQLNAVGGFPHVDTFNQVKFLKREIDPDNRLILLHGDISHEDLCHFYRDADVFLLASTCETFGQVITEAMIAGLPIMCTKESAMSEILADGALYFDAHDIQNIAQTLVKLIESPQLREKISEKSFKYGQMYSWERCANETFGFLREVALEN